MRVMIDALSARIGGGRSYILNLIPQLLAAEPENHYYLLISKGQFPDFRSGDRLTVREVKELPILFRIAYQQLVLPLLAKKWKIDVLFSVSDIAPIAAHCKVVLAIRNPNPYQNYYPFTSGQYWRMKCLLLLSKLSTRKAAGVFFMSNHSMRVASRRLSCNLVKCRVIYHGVSPLFLQQTTQPEVGSAAQHLPTSRPYLLFVSSLYLYKNVGRLVEAFARCCSKPGFRHDLVIAGGFVERSLAKQLPAQILELGLSDRVHLLGDLPPDRLPVLYRSASLFVFPSYLETFGHPLIEAMACGVPIVAANSASTPEIAGDAALYFDPFNVQSIADLIEAVINDPILSSQLLERGFARVKQFSWDRTASNTLKLFAKAHAGVGSQG